jgi:molybdopterin molybdotransferase
MVKVEQALEIILNHTVVLDTEEKPLLKCLGQVLAEDIRAQFDMPQLDTGGPDGYAVRSEDIKSASRDNPVTLRIIGTVRAGYFPKRTVQPGTAIRIMTGSVVPEGADCVVRFEDTDEPGNKNGPNPDNPSDVRFFSPSRPGANICSAGSRYTKGSPVIPAGIPVGPSQISTIASLGLANVRVIRRPVIAVISTGDELINLNQSPAPAKIYNCNTVAVSSLITYYGGVPHIIGIARDKESSLNQKIQKSLFADAIITSGGVSMGDYDLVRLVLGKTGQVLFSRINMGPGKSLAFGLVYRTSPSGEKIPVPVFALSGPPVGCINNFETLVRPALLKMMGFSALNHPSVEAVAMDSDLMAKSFPFIRWTRLEKVQGEYRVTLNGHGKPGPPAGVETANSITIIPENTPVQKGDRIQVLPLEWCRDYLNR